MRCWPAVLFKLARPLYVTAEFYGTYHLKFVVTEGI